MILALNLILERYYNRDVVHTFINLTFFILAIVLSNLLIRLFNEAYSNGFGVDVVFKYVILTIPQDLAYLLPITISLSITLCFGKYFSNNEMFVTLAGGITWAQIIKNLLKPILFISFIALCLSMYILPFSNQTTMIFQTSLAAKTMLQAVSDKKIIKIPNGTITGYIGQKDDDFLKDIFLYQIGSPKYTVITAPTGHIASESNSSSIILDNANIYTINPITNETSYGTAVKAEDIMYQQSKDYQRDNFNKFYPGELITNILQSSNSTYKRYALTELVTRFGSFFTVIIAAILALSMCRLRPRQNKYAKLLPSAAVLSIYLSASMFVNTLMLSGTIPIWIGAWICHAIFGSIAIYNLRKQNGSEKIKKLKRK
ncbi:LptF/LptG family permease [Pseudofrancisella aestuarii]|uniref:LptF/LptG family permease n=1 Tax=Pseudofrancisella aestuarii TaxID=2670347 RepID=A0ABV9TCP2_9GAMM|nr:LptF/LptG family permease [Pseudofrancisella aestuarii]